MESSLAALDQKLHDDFAKHLRRLEFLMDSSPMVVYTCEPHGDFGATFVSAGVKTLWGYEPAEFLGEPGFWIKHVHPDDVAQIAHEFKRLLDDGHNTHEYRFRTKSGEYRWVHDQLRLVRDTEGKPREIVGHCIDITNRKLAEAALGESESRLSLIFNSTSDMKALFRAEPGGEYITEAVNRALIENFRKSTGGDARDFIGRSFTALLAATGLTPDEVEGRRSVYEKVIQGGAPARFFSPSSAVRDAAEISVYPVRNHGGLCTHVLWSGSVVTERLKAEAALRESEERYALVTQATNDGIYDWNLVSGQSYLSPRYKEMLGYADDELPNDSSSFFDQVHPDDIGRLREVITHRKTDPGQSQWSNELRLRCKDGTYRWMASRGKALRDDGGKPIRIIGSVSDITERLEAATKLAANKKRLRDILDSLFGFVLVTTPEGIVVDCNRASLEPWGLKKEHVFGKAFRDTPWCYGQETGEPERVHQNIVRAARGDVVRCEITARAKEGLQISMDVTFSPLRDTHGVITNVVVFGIDVTQRAEAEAQLRLAKQIAETSSRAKSEFLANMSHEIRTPMNGIIGLTEVVLETELTADQREYLGMVRTSADALLSIITAILDISKLQAGKLILQPKEFWLQDLIMATLKGPAAAARAKNVPFTWKAEANVPEVLLGDSNCLRQVLGNIAGNAVKFTAAGEITVLVESSPDDAGLLYFTVRDTGIGVPAAKQKTIFEPFSPVDGSKRREFGGAGLGLAISAQLVEMMGGQIWLESDGATGSTFHFTVSMKVALTQTDERRRDTRYSADESAWMEIEGLGSLGGREVRVVDISKSGLKFCSEDFLDPGTRIQIHRDGSARAAVVRYCAPGEGGFLTGVRFLDD